MKTTVSCKLGTDAILSQYLISGTIGGIAGGLVFGMMMWKMGMLTTIGSMVGFNSALVGFVVHLIISILFGLLGGILLKIIPSCIGKKIFFAMIYGAILWVMGSLIAMPMMMGGALFQINPIVMMSLIGHIIYAVVTLLVADAVLPFLTAKKV